MNNMTLDTDSPIWRTVMAHIQSARASDLTKLAYNGTNMDTTQYLRGRLAAWAEIEALPQPAPTHTQPLR